MRDLEFRVWDKKHERFLQGGEIIFGLYGEADIVVNINEQSYDNGENRQQDFIIQQGTGLKDKNGVKIFEGDIVRFNGARKYTDIKSNIFEVVFRFGFELSNDETNEKYDDGLYFGDCHLFAYSQVKVNGYDIEVIGNIYENKELSHNTGGVL